MIFNQLKFANAVKRIHLKPEEISTYELIPDSEVRTKFNGFIDDGENPQFSAALDEICENIVGRTMFKVLITKLTTLCIKMQILEHSNPDSGSCYDDKKIVWINFSFYTESR